MLLLLHIARKRQIVKRICIAIAGLATFLLSSCGSTVVNYYEPQASWGKPSFYTFCPTSSSALEISPPDFPWYEIKIGIWNDLHAQNLRRRDPTVFFSFFKKEPYFGLGRNSEVYAARKASSIKVKALPNYLTVLLSDGSSQRFTIPELEDEVNFVGSKVGDLIHVSLVGISPQSFEVELPQLMINGKSLPMGKVKFRYDKMTQNGGC